MIPPEVLTCSTFSSSSLHDPEEFCLDPCENPDCLKNHFQSPDPHVKTNTIQ